MKKKTESIINFQHLLKSPHISLEERLSKIELSQSKVDEIKNKKTVDTLTDKILGSFKIGEIIQTIINWNEDVNKEIKKEKERILISNLLNKVDENELKLNLVIDFFKNPYGLTLTNKILEIANQSPPDKELLMYLSNVLKNVVTSDFISLYSKHKFFINLIEQLSPQSLTILIDYRNWPTFKSKKKLGYHISMGIITTPWTNDFAISYINKKGFDNTDTSLLNMIDYSTLSLLTNNLVVSNPDHINGNGMKMTELGKELLDYLK